MLLKNVGFIVCVICFRVPEPQKPQVKPPEDIVRANNYDPEEDEEYYRKQLSYFDRRNFDKPTTAIPANILTEPSKPGQSQSQVSFNSYPSKYVLTCCTCLSVTSSLHLHPDPLQ